MHFQKKQAGFPKITAILLLLLLTGCFSSFVKAQNVDKDKGVPESDLKDEFRKLFNKKTDTSIAPKPPGVAILPSVGYNPSMGFVIGAKLSAGKQLGSVDNTNFSIFGLEALISSKGIITVQARHNIFTIGNKWNLQGNWQLSKFGIIDYGIGTWPISFQ
jgi:hypothetical protein